MGSKPLTEAESRMVLTKGAGNGGAGEMFKEQEISVRQRNKFKRPTTHVDQSRQEHIACLNIAKKVDCK